MMTTGVVGSGLPIAVGLALAAQLDQSDRVVLVTFGDGATSIGAYHEALNLAALWRLPIVFLCQNNQWAEHTPIAEYSPNPHLASRAASYGLAAEQVDGFDLLATWRKLKLAIDGCRSGDGPWFVECRTYRLGGHVGTGDYSYMPSDDLQSGMDRDPAPTFRKWLLDKGHVGEARLEELDKQARATVDDAFEAAYASPPPSPEELYTDVFAGVA
jgi:pyruvate dehydrogenase E1 component alpha subunit